MLKYRPQPIITTLTRLQLLSNDELREEAERRGDTLALVLCQRLEDAEEEFNISDEIRRLEDDHDETERTYEAEIAGLQDDVDELEDEVRKLETRVRELEEELAAAETRLALLKEGEDGPSV